MAISLMFCLIVLAGCSPFPTVPPLPQITMEPQLAHDGFLEKVDQRLREADGMRMLYVPAGTFRMGSLPNVPGVYENELPEHEQAVAAYFIDQTEVTNAQYLRCVDAGSCKPPRPISPPLAAYDDPLVADYPVVNINWYQAVAYCDWVGGRLPGEVEWAFAAKGPESLAYPWGESFDEGRLNYCDSNCDSIHADPDVDDGYAQTAPVGTYVNGASWVGAYDVLGNVWEWVWDWHEYYPGHRWEQHLSSIQPNTYRVLRGGGWDTVRGHARSAFRNWHTPASSGDSIGFRCVMDVAEAP